MRRISRWLLVAGALSFGGVAGAQQPPQQQQQQAAPTCNCMGGGGRGMMMGSPMGKARVSVENTPNGAILRFSASDPRDVQAIQEHARMMSTCMGGGANANPPPRGP